MFLLPDHDTNYINVVPLPSRKSSELVTAFEMCYKEVTDVDFKGQLLWLDKRAAAPGQDRDVVWRVCEPLGEMPIGAEIHIAASDVVTDFGQALVCRNGQWARASTGEVPRRAVPLCLRKQ